MCKDGEAALSLLQIGSAKRGHILGRRDYRDRRTETRENKGGTIQKEQESREEVEEMGEGKGWME